MTLIEGSRTAWWTADSSSSGIGGTIVLSCSGRLSVIVAIASSTSYSRVSKLMVRPLLVSWPDGHDRARGMMALPPEGRRAALLLIDIQQGFDDPGFGRRNNP